MIHIWVYCVFMELRPGSFDPEKSKKEQKKPRKGRTIAMYDSSLSESSTGSRAALTFDPPEKSIDGRGRLGSTAPAINSFSWEDMQAQQPTVTSNGGEEIRSPFGGSSVQNVDEGFRPCEH